MTRSQAQPSAAPFRRALRTLALPFIVTLAACGDGASPPPDPQGTFGDSAVSGLNYTSPAGSGVTDASGRYSYRAGQSISFSIGNLTLGSASGASTLTPLGITAGAALASDPAVNNKLILLQTLDADGNLNNGIQITDAIRTIVSAQAAAINFNQPTTAFRTSLAALMTALNTGNVFTDTDPRDRTVRTAAAALEHYTRATAERNTVTLDTGALRGYSATAGTWQYLGIPYARPPLGDLRWRPPQAPLAWTGVRDAVAWGDQAPQNPSYQAFGEGGMSEDCLYLNVTAPKNAANLPVMVWFHGGGFVILTGNTKAFNNPASLPTRDVVLVTVTHRLGPFGYLAHPALTTESGYGGSGNYGQMDLIASLQWVQRNIARFGGNPDNVTIFGESGGGGKVISLMNSPIATGLFHKAIVQSGMAESAMAILNVPPLAQAEAVGTGLLTRLNTPTLAEARAKTWVEIINAELAHYPRGDYRDAYGPNIDSRYATKSMRQSIEDGLPSDVPLLAGNNSGDMPGLITGMIEQMPWRSSHNQAPQYVYKFSKVPAGWAARGVLSYHGGELVYTFNYTPSLVSHHLLGLVIDPATGANLAIGDLNGNGITGSAGDAADVLASAGYNADDAAVAQTMMTMWTNFARTGNPSTPAFTWTPYTTANDTYVEIDTTLTTRTGLATGW
jgi:para-nitrobenzyl esterase